MILEDQHERGSNLDNNKKDGDSSLYSLQQYLFVPHNH